MKAAITTTTGLKKLQCVLSRELNVCFRTLKDVVHFSFSCKPKYNDNVPIYGVLKKRRKYHICNFTIIGMKLILLVIHFFI